MMWWLWVVDWNMRLYQDVRNFRSFCPKVIKSVRWSAESSMAELIWGQTGLSVMWEWSIGSSVLANCSSVSGVVVWFVRSCMQPRAIKWWQICLLSVVSPESLRFIASALTFLVHFMSHKAVHWSSVTAAFTRFGIRAIHIEMLPSLETDAFINGLTRFVARRGCPAKILSDNGTNLVGAQAELSRSFRQLDRGKIVAAARRQNIEWKFNPPYGSHHGGLWERMIRTIRQVLVALLFSVSRLNDDVLHTVFCEVENVVNSRPLTKLSDDIHDDNPITPNHLLLLRGNYAYPWGVTQESDTYRRCWRHVQHLVTQFWRKWLKLYIPELQRRQKWLKPSPNIKTGDLVLIVDENSPRGSWPLGLIQDTNVGRDGLVRSAKIRTRSSVFVRPVTKLVLLESTHYA